MKNIRNLDLNLLVVFEALLRLKNTTLVARELHLGQPTVSHALSRLRRALGDPLFVRAPRGLIPTGRALALSRPIQDFLLGIEGELSKHTKVDLAKIETIFRITSTEAFDLLALPQLITELKKMAPLVTLVTRPALSNLPAAEMQEGKIDLAIAGYFGELPSGFFQQEIFGDDFVAIKKKQKKKRKLTLQEYIKHPHLLVSRQGDLKAPADVILKDLGVSRKIVAGAASFANVPWMLAQNPELMLTCPRKLARLYLDYFPLESQELPYDLPGFSVLQIWHERQHHDPLHCWIRQAIFRICQKL